MALSEDEDAEIQRFIATVSEIRGQLRGWDLRFFDDMVSRYEENGGDIFISPKQWENIRRIMERA